MEGQLYLKMLKKFNKGGVNLNGIICNPIKVGDYDGVKTFKRIHFRIENPNNISYTEPGLIAQLTDEVDFFNRTIGLGEKSEFNINIDDIKKIYLGPDVSDYVTSEMSNITKLKSDIYIELLDDNSEKVYDVIFVKHKSVEYMLDGDFVNIMNKVTPIKALQYRVEDDSPIREISLTSAISGYALWQNQYHYDETDINYPQFDNFFSQESQMNFIDPDFQAPYVTTIFQ